MASNKEASAPISMAAESRFLDILCGMLENETVIDFILGETSI